MGVCSGFIGVLKGVDGVLEAGGMDAGFGLWKAICFCIDVATQLKVRDSDS